ncbi:SixA phosphatase family protein [Litorilituus sediminis]|uniref:Histidine phosphatase family protein n=1 Tax=Litorilituus sediminis TaxID=718192 RepID=A0A4P6PAB9_9GAMM|nr:histidine phosphatase family protein [Litorilituus sediminis]QBG36555.1 histidine phosphatase family protein [Litorilituus sediminis]
MTYKSICISVAMLLSVGPVAADNFSIYLTRHAEKENGQQDKNPSLTRCGKVRAQQLATILSDAKLESVYSTSFQRTMQTALPIATAQKKSIKNYNPRFLFQVANQLKQNRENALVVGHSNTTPELVELLSGERVDEIKEGNYQVLYQVQFVDEQAIVTKFMQPLVCRN